MGSPDAAESSGSPDDAIVNILVKAIGKKPVLVQVQQDCSVAVLRSQAAQAAGLHCKGVEVVFKGCALQDHDCAPKFRHNDTVLVFVAPKVSPKPLSWLSAADQTEAEEEAEAKLLLRNLSRTAPAWKVRLVTFLKTRCRTPDDVILYVMNIPFWKWLLFASWAAASRVAARNEWGPIYLILTGFVVIFSNLGKRAEGEMSAYSVFNEGYQELPGTFNAERVDQQVRHGQM
ncbi:hypothetical protein CYMTET_19303 [Cymbomonas tetramitiformis]|uniref:Ubiquitin-like domain-containing protein n=1 Tax=Cymbomonas tetramitiformis TaxID=36881 RepID=A0AAE0L509_9CHLO|nr:hypothetical protein CYMTET_19303 [Cymbomonas tetramitiformis]